MSCIYVSEDDFRLLGKCMCYCEDCAPDDATPYPFSESDFPNYCEECGDLLDVSYTDYARLYQAEIMPTYGDSSRLRDQTHLPTSALTRAYSPRT